MSTGSIPKRNTESNKEGIVGPTLRGQYLQAPPMIKADQLAFRRFKTCVTRARLTPRWRASSALVFATPESRSDW